MSKILSVFVALLAVCLVVSTRPVEAEQRVLTDDEIQQVRDTCEGAQRVIGDLYNSDALLRVNLGQQYENIAKDLMIPLNNRLASNKMNASNLITITSQYDSAIATYKKTYHSYYNQLEKAKDMDCKAQPIEFYALIEELRTYRDTLRDQVKAINAQAINYQIEFRKLRDGQAGISQ